jgi:uncharacterized Zn-finger protein
MKYKPTIWGMTREVAKLNNPNLTALSGILETIGFLGNAHYNRSLIYSCGNPQCNKPFEPFKSTAQRPLVCSYCGEEIDWQDIATRKIRVCPQCKREYRLNESYCSYHIPKIQLIEKEIPI